MWPFTRPLRSRPSRVNDLIRALDVPLHEPAPSASVRLEPGPTGNPLDRQLEQLHQADEISPPAPNPSRSKLKHSTSSTKKKKAVALPPATN